jgi:thioredoxin reductase
MIDILIVGAGPSGLCAAKTFLQHDPHTDIVLLDAYSSLGGVWSEQQLYPTLKTNNLHSAVDFTDFPMDDKFGIKPGEHVSGEAMNAYLKAYAQHYGVAGKIRFNTRVMEIRRSGKGNMWEVEIQTASQPGRECLECARLVIATGVLSEPHLPALKGLTDFNAPFIHSSELGHRVDDIFKSPDVKTIAVLGGSKSSYDAVYLAATTGHKVEWIIRKSGRGPVWVFPPHTMLGPFKAWRERLVTRRFFSFMSPCIFTDFSGLGWIKKFLHFTGIGKAISQGFWAAIRHDTIRDCGYETDKRFHILQPEQNPFWYVGNPLQQPSTVARSNRLSSRYGTASGVLNYEQDFWSFIRNGQVRIHREDISSVSDHTIHLRSGVDLQVDTLIASTGFSAKPNLSFEPATTHSDLGIPSVQLSKTQTDSWAELDSRADQVIGEQYPRLLLGPFTAPDSSVPKPFNPGMSAEVPYTPWRLYRGIAPPGLTARGDHSLVFIGMFSNIANTIRLEVQCLWALAYLNGKIPNVTKDMAEGKVFEETAVFQRFTQRRAPYGHGRFYPDLVFDQLPYWDLLLNDVGLATKRKANTFKELFEPYSQTDYRGIVHDWIQRHQ